MPLEINKVAQLLIVRRVEEMIEADFEQRGSRRVRGDMSADAVVAALARTTIAIAFQRIRLESAARSPGRRDISAGPRPGSC